MNVNSCVLPAGYRRYRRVINVISCGLLAIDSHLSRVEFLEFDFLLEFNVCIYLYIYNEPITNECTNS